MCFRHEGRPPALPFPMAGGAADGRRVTLGDGNRFQAYLARAVVDPSPVDPPMRAGAAIVILPDVRGLAPYYEELADRFAEVGVHALAVDLYARSAGDGARGPDFDGHGHAERTTQAGIAEDIGTAVGFLRGPEVGARAGIFTLGFCFGGRRSLLQAVEPHGLAGVIGFYGVPVGSGPNSEAPADGADRFRCPVLAIYGGADAAIPAEAVATLDDALERAAVEHETVVYPGAPHSFFDRMQAEYAEASADAWHRVLAFVARHA